jgi:hypothetical protein
LDNGTEIKKCSDDQIESLHDTGLSGSDTRRLKRLHKLASIIRKGKREREGTFFGYLLHYLSLLKWLSIFGIPELSLFMQGAFVQPEPLSSQVCQQAVYASELLSLCLVNALEEDASGRVRIFLKTALSVLLSLEEILDAYDQLQKGVNPLNFAFANSQSIPYAGKDALSGAVDDALHRIVRGYTSILSSSISPIFPPTSRLALSLDKRLNTY